MKISEDCCCESPGPRNLYPGFVTSIVPFRLLRPLLGGLAGAWLARVAVEFVGTIALPSAGTAQAYPTRSFARFLCLLTVSGLSSVGVAESLRSLKTVPIPVQMVPEVMTEDPDRQLS